MYLNNLFLHDPLIVITRLRRNSDVMQLYVHEVKMLIDALTLAVISGSEMVSV